MRALMIVAGYEAITNFKPVLLVFAGILIFSSYKLITESGEEEDEDMSENAIVQVRIGPFPNPNTVCPYKTDTSLLQLQFCSKLLPVSEAYDGDNFWTEVKVRICISQTPRSACLIDPNTDYQDCLLLVTLTGVLW